MIRNDHQPLLLSEDDGIPVLDDIVNALAMGDPIPLLDEIEKNATPDLTGLSTALQTTLNRELEGVIDNAVHERLRATIEEMAGDIKEQVRARLENTVQTIVDAALHETHSKPTAPPY